MISTGNGVLANLVNREGFFPTDEVKYIPANDESEALTFVPVDFSVNPLVYVYWRFADQSNIDVAFKQTIIHPKVQVLMNFSKAMTPLDHKINH